ERPRLANRFAVIPQLQLGQLLSPAPYDASDSIQDRSTLMRLEAVPFRPATGGIGRLDRFLDVRNVRSGEFGVHAVVSGIARRISLPAAGAPLTSHEDWTEHGSNP